MTVDEIVEETIRLEGGYVNDPDDSGGPTNYGITLKTLSLWLKRDVTAEDVRRLDKETAKEIYLSQYYYAPRINSLPDALEPQIFDMAVNHGPKRAIQILQRVLNLAGFTVDTDGVIGPQTRRQAESAYKEMGGYLINAIQEARDEFYEAIVAARPSQAKFLRGWKNRSIQFRVEVSDNES